MKTIEIDGQVFEELANRATGFHVTPNDVLRRILNLTASAPSPSKTVSKPIASTLIEFLKSEQFQRCNQAIDRYLVILGWLHSTTPKQFVEAVLKFHRGSRMYFAKSEKEILESGDGVTARQIPQSPFWALATLDNKSKRLVIEDILLALGYALGDINIVLNELPDSGIRRNHSRLLKNLLQ